ncbi:unnamed protein product [Soboliphyme baturini]|uniref:Uncharacterized protein n=1 Tax=Soboliphyme baturini TaxID=241478 RepID=A0A183IVS2_9BILA|nr:unnamed protein product [Soboliphyme baturini]
MMRANESLIGGAVVNDGGGGGDEGRLFSSTSHLSAYCPPYQTDGYLFPCRSQCGCCRARLFQQRERCEQLRRYADCDRQQDEELVEEELQKQKEVSISNPPSAGRSPPPFCQRPSRLTTTPQLATARCWQWSSSGGGGGGGGGSGGGGSLVALVSDCCTMNERYLGDASDHHRCQDVDPGRGRGSHAGRVPPPPRHYLSLLLTVITRK